MKGIYIILIVLIVLIAGGAVWYFLVYQKSATQTQATSSPAAASNQIDPNNKFGWLGGADVKEEYEYVKSAGGGWMRPHPGPAVWDMMQKEENGEINFDGMDKVVQTSQEVGVNLLITLWPFAEWDQKNRPDADACRVSSQDEFLPKNDEKGRSSYLPEHRCNPNSWEKYETWVKKVVERYDFDGQDDMPGLKYVINRWEAMNEPDLSWKNAGPESGRLTFYKQAPKDYGELLGHTNSAVKAADANAKVVIAGAAGASPEQLGFYTQVFEQTPEAKNNFDIGNVHCISNDQLTKDLNVASYKKMLEQAGITGKPIWVTEAETMSENKTAQEHADDLKASIQAALATGAEKIFFTRYDLADTRKDMSKQKESRGEEESIQLYKQIIENFQ